MLLRVGRSSSQTVNYSRPLFELDSNPIDATDQVTLPSGKQVIDRLYHEESFEPNRLTKIAIGYEMTKRSAALVTLEPYWFVLYENSWQKVKFDQQGEGDDELE